MVSEEQAVSAIQKNLPNGKIQAGPVQYQGKWLFSVFLDDELDGSLDPFYAVDIQSGQFSGFSITQDPDTIIDLFEKNIRHSEFLAHYGVKGMKWGVRKDNNTSGTSSIVNGPTQASKSIESGLNQVKPLLGMVVPTANLRGKAITMAMVAARTGGKVSMATLKASFVSPAAIAGYAVSAVDSGAYRIPGMLAKNAIRGGWPKNEALSKSNMGVQEIQDKVVKAINPQYPGIGTTNNCLRCSYTYEMRRRGFDVAATKTIMASGQTGLGQNVMTGFKNVRTRVTASQPKYTGIVGAIRGNRPTEADVFKTLAQQPNRSRGEFQMSWGTMMGGHSISYEIVNRKPVLFDTQSGRTYSKASELEALTRRAKSFKYTRLDDKNLDEFALPAWIKIVAND